jgi:hypothetical protein
MDFMTFSGDIDMSLTYLENKHNIESQLETLLPKKIEKEGKTASYNDKVEKEKKEIELKAEQEQRDKEIKERLDKEIEAITKDSQELEKLYYTPIRYIEMIANKKERGLLLFGESSLGKSYRVKEVLKRLGVKNYFFVSGHITPMKFYEKLYRAKDDLVIFDDVNILDNLIILNMIKASLNENSGNVVEYHTTKKMDIPNSFVFNGQVIMLLNDIPKRNEHLKAIESRVLKYHLSFTREEILKIIFEIAHKKDIEGTTLQDRLEVAKWIRDNTNKATQNLNIRLYLQTINFFRYDRENWKSLAGKQILTDEYLSLIIQGVSSDEFTEQTGLSKSTMIRLKRQFGLTRAYGVVGK